jgi:hypothetical protein
MLNSLAVERNLVVQEYSLQFHSNSALNLQQASGLLAELGQVASASVKNTIKPFVEAVGQQSIVRHKDRDVKLLAASCISEVLRLCAPDAPYEDPTLKVGLQFRHKYS